VNAYYQLIMTPCELRATLWITVVKVIIINKFTFETASISIPPAQKSVPTWAGVYILRY